MAAVWADTLIRFQQSGYKPARTVKMALTCGEETDTAFDGAQYLADNKRDLIDAEFALNEGGGGDTDGKGKIIDQGIQVGEKIYQDYKLVATNPGGHSSQPVRDNAMYAMSEALLKVRDHEFPQEFSDTTRVFFERTGAARKDDLGNAMMALAKDPNDAKAAALVNTDKGYHSMLRTTCVGTMIEGGHAAEWHVDPHKVGVLGFSAGGYLAAVASTQYKRRWYARIDAADDESARPDFALPIYPGHLTDDAHPFNRDVPVTRDTPPTFLLQAEDDTVDGVEQSLAYYIALKNAHAPVEMHLYAHGGHAFGLRPTAEPITHWPVLAEAWLHTIGVLPAEH